MNRKSNMLAGIIIIILGVLFLLKNMDILIFDINIGFLISRFWPAMFLIIPGLAFHYAFFTGRNRDPGLLVPGGILLILGLTFQINMLFGMWVVTWPIYIFSVAFGLSELYWFGPRDKGLLIPIGILGGLSVVFFTTFSLRELLNFNVSKFIVPVVLIALGISISVKGRSRGGDF